jgi:hypothetical protein
VKTKRRLLACYNKRTGSCFFANPGLFLIRFQILLASSEVSMSKIKRTSFDLFKSDIFKLNFPKIPTKIILI